MNKMTFEEWEKERLLEKEKAVREILNRLVNGMHRSVATEEANIIFDQALSALREVVLGKKIDKKSVMHQLDIESHIRGYNKALEDIANLFGGGK